MGCGQVYSRARSEEDSFVGKLTLSPPARLIRINENDPGYARASTTYMHSRVGVEGDMIGMVEPNAVIFVELDSIETGTTTTGVTVFTTLKWDLKDSLKEAADGVGSAIITSMWLRLGDGNELVSVTHPRSYSFNKKELILHALTHGKASEHVPSSSRLVPLPQPHVQMSWPLCHGHYDKTTTHFEAVVSSTSSTLPSSSSSSESSHRQKTQLVASILIGKREKPLYMVPLSVEKPVFSEVFSNPCTVDREVVAKLDFVERRGYLVSIVAAVEIGRAERLALVMDGDEITCIPADVGEDLFEVYFGSKPTTSPWSQMVCLPLCISGASNSIQSRLQNTDYRKLSGALSLEHVSADTTFEVRITRTISSSLSDFKAMIKACVIGVV